MAKLKIHSENILPIIKKWLYTDRDIFLRELVSNASDALNKLKTIACDEKLSIDTESFAVDVTFDKEAKTLKISDNGIGMSADEVETYIAQIAFSGAEEFVKHYKSDKEEDQIIGHFGLGFYSAFMVADKVEVETLSYKEGAKAAHFTSDGSIEYTLEEGAKESRGTTITLHINDDDFLNDRILQDTLLKYCRFLGFPLTFNGTRLNNKEPLFHRAPSECTDQDYKDFYKTLYPLDPDPIFWIHLNIDYPFNLKGILYFPKIDRSTSLDKSQIQLFCHRIFVSDNLSDLLPDFLTILKGAIESGDIPLNVSRSNLQMDRTVRQIASHISKKVADRLRTLSTQDREAYIKIWPDIENILKLGALQDEKFFERIEDLLIWKTTKGEWTNIKDYLERAKEAKILYTNDEKAHALTLFEERDEEVLILRSHLDSPLMSHIERKHTPAQCLRIDAELSDTLIDTSKEKTLLDEEGKTLATKMAEFFKGQLASDEALTVSAKSLKSEKTPALILVDEGTRRLREYMNLTQQQLGEGYPEKREFVINTNNPLTQKIYDLKDSKPELAQALAVQLHQMTLLAQRELDPQMIPELMASINQTVSSLL